MDELQKHHPKFSKKCKTKTMRQNVDECLPGAERRAGKGSRETLWKSGTVLAVM
jgi:hypothetical protein